MLVSKKNIDDFFDNLSDLKYIILSPLNNTDYPERYDKLLDNIKSIEDEYIREDMIRYLSRRVYTFHRFR